MLILAGREDGWGQSDADGAPGLSPTRLPAVQVLVGLGKPCSWAGRACRSPGLAPAPPPHLEQQEAFQLPHDGGQLSQMESVDRVENEAGV